jgi:hypothetical protein
MTTIEQAYVGYNQSERAYAPYSGRLTALKEAKLRKALAEAGFHPGWKTSAIRIEPANAVGLSPYREDGAGGFSKIKIIQVEA